MTAKHVSRHMRSFRATLALSCALILPAVVALAETQISPSYQPVTDARLNAAQSDAGWLMYRHDYTSSGYSPLSNITGANVNALKAAWDYKSSFEQGHESPPVINGDYMFVTTPKDEVHAFQSSTGKALWTYKHDLTQAGLKTVCCDVVNRGVALYGNNVFLATLDNFVVALDAKTGHVVWKTQLAPADQGKAMTLAPLVVKGRVIIGTSGGEYGARGSVVALDAATGNKVWERFTVPSPEEKGGNTWPKGAYKTGGGGAWLTGTYDAATNSLFWGVGNPGPWLATLRPGTNLYTDSVLSLDPDTGAVKWYYQYTPHDTWDYDGTNETVMTDISYNGTAHKALVSASRNGWFYAIDRESGKLIYAVPFAHATSVSGVKDGLMVTDDTLRPAVGKQVFTCPSFLGGKNWWPIATDPQTHMAYVPTMHTCMTIKGVAGGAYKAGLPFLDESFKVVRDPLHPDEWGSVQAIDLNTGKQAWRFGSKTPWNDGMLATAGGLVFSGSAEGYLYAFDAKTGAVKWKSPQMSSGIIGVPSTWKVGNKQYVGVWAGWGGATPIWGGEMAKDPAVSSIPTGGHLYVFSL